MTEVGGPGDKAQKFATQLSQKAQKIRTQAMAKAPQLTGPLAQKAQRVVQEKPGTAAAGVVLAVLGLLVLRRRPRRRVKARQARGRSPISRAWRWARALAVLGVLIRRRRRRQEDS
jgi:MYXO-CTERM domain-containing protein